jgi:hypothetical protein
MQHRLAEAVPPVLWLYAKLTQELYVRSCGIRDFCGLEDVFAEVIEHGQVGVVHGGVEQGQEPREQLQHVHFIFVALHITS